MWFWPTIGGVSVGGGDWWPSSISQGITWISFHFDINWLTPTPPPPPHLSLANLFNSTSHFDGPYGADDDWSVCCCCSNCCKLHRNLGTISSSATRDWVRDELGMEDRLAIRWWWMGWHFSELLQLCNSTFAGWAIYMIIRSRANDLKLLFVGGWVTRPVSSSADV